MTTEHHFDVVVVGCGIAGMSAAVSAEQAGAKVAVLERSSFEERGGNTRYTESLWRMKSEEEVSDDFEDKLGANGALHPDPDLVKDAVLDYENWPGLLKAAGMADPNLVAALAHNAPKAVKWLKSFGVKFDEIPTYFLSQSTTRIAPVGGGLALIEALGAHADASDNITFFYETTANRLLTDDKGDVVGIGARGKENRPVNFMAASVILGCGGFEGNQAMLAHYIGPQSAYTRPVARGGYYNRGEGVQMALDIGAAPCGNFGSFHAQPVDPRSEDWEPVVLNYALGILVNEKGERFTDEAPAMTDAVYEVISRRIMMEPHGLAWSIHDATLDDVENWSITVRSRVAPIVADTLDELAAKLDIVPEVLTETVDAYNNACPHPDGFNPLETDGLATSGLNPRKSNWARTVAKGPFKAWPIVAANCFTFGGLKVNASSRVVNTAGDEIPGLYAAGETVGLYYDVYPGATSVLRGAVTGRLAGVDAANKIS